MRIVHVIILSYPYHHYDTRVYAATITAVRARVVPRV